MRKLFFLFLVVGFVYPAVSFAQESKTTVSESAGDKFRNQLQLLEEVSPTVTNGNSISVFEKEKILLFFRIDAALYRFTIISDKITSRISKLQITSTVSNRFTSQNQEIISKIKSLRSGMETLEKKATGISYQSGSPQYLSFKKDVSSVIVQLDNILSLNKKLVSDMKKYRSIVVSPTPDNNVIEDSNSAK